MHTTIFSENLIPVASMHAKMAHKHTHLGSTRHGPLLSLMLNMQRTQTQIRIRSETSRVYIKIIGIRPTGVSKIRVSLHLLNVQYAFFAVDRPFLAYFLRFNRAIKKKSIANLMHRLAAGHHIAQ